MVAISRRVMMYGMAMTALSLACKGYAERKFTGRVFDPQGRLIGQQPIVIQQLEKNGFAKININGKPGYTLAGESGRYAAMTDPSGKIMGWEHSYCHEPAYYRIVDGRPVEILDGDLKTLKPTGYHFRAVWEGTSNEQLIGPAPGGRIIAFIEDTGSR